MTTTNSERSAGWARSATLALLAWFATRAVLAMIAGWSFRIDGHPAPWVQLWVQWDAGYYLDVAAHGYAIPPVVTGDETGQSGLNFFPLLPMGIAFLHLLGASPVLAGLIFSNLCLLGAAVLLHRLTLRRIGTEAADFAVFSLMLLPGSFALSGIMTEAPFLFFSIAAVFFAKGRPEWQSASIGLLGITRLTGIVLLAGAAIDWAIDRWRGRSATYRTLLLLALSPLPLVLYAAVMFALTGDALAAVHSHQAFWAQRTKGPFAGFLLFLTTPDQRLQIESAISLSMFAVLLSRLRLFSVGEWVFLLVSIGTSSSADSLIPSLIRYMIALYPLHMAMGDLCRRFAVARLLLCLYAMIDGALMIGWVHGRDVFE